MKNNKNLKFCINCGYINHPEDIKCRHCGNNLFTEPSDPVQVAKSEGHFLGAMASGKYEAIWYRVILAFFIGLIFLFPAIIYLYVLFSEIFISQELDQYWLVFAILASFPILFLGVIGFFILVRAISKFFLIGKNK